MSKSLYERLGGHNGILELLHYFYADVRQHNVLGPIFNAKIHDWPSHIAKIAEFWARQTGGPSSYPGGFAGAHLRLGIGAEHFQHWLALWEMNCRRNLPAGEAKEMTDLARLLGDRLLQILGGRSGLMPGQP